MKNIFKRRSVAIGLTSLVVLGCLVYGWSNRTDTSASDFQGVQTVTVQQSLSSDWIRDEADVLSGQTETLLSTYNAGWDSDYGSVVAVATVNGTGGEEIEDYALDYGSDMNLGGNDMLLLIDADDKDAYFVVSGSEIVPDKEVEEAYYDTFYPKFQRGDYDAALRDFFTQMNLIYEAYAVKTGTPGSGTVGQTEGDSEGSAILGIIFLLGIAFFILSAFDRLRYRSWRSRYPGGVGAPAFIPLLFWRRPGSRWFRRMEAEYPPRTVYRGSTNNRTGRSTSYSTRSSSRGSSSFGSRGGFSGGSSFGSRGGFGGGSSFGSRGGFGGRK